MGRRERPDGRVRTLAPASARGAPAPGGLTPIEPAELAHQVGLAEARIRPHLLTTPLLASTLGDSAGAALHLKLENRQHTGSFKARGAFNALLTLAPSDRARGVIAASTGNHGAAVAFAGREIGVPVRVVVSTTADPEKIEKIRSLGAGVLVHGDDSALAEVHARGLAASEGVPFISPYNDPMVVAGQGTCGVELAGQLDRADAVFIALGGGGLLSGMAAWLAEAWPGVAIIGCSPENSAVMIRSLEAGELLELPSEPTLSDGTAGGVEPGAVTFPWCRRFATELVTVTEEEIAQAMRAVHAAHGLAIEGAAGVALAAFRRDPARWRGGRVVVVICGGNVSPAVLSRVL